MTKLTVFVNRFGVASEVFLLQLLKALGRDFEIEVTSLQGIKKQVDTGLNFKVREAPSRYGSRFISFAAANFNKASAVKGIKNKLRYLYNFFLLSTVRSEKIYFPFLAMTRQFGEQIPAVNKQVYTSIRGTDITVTPYLNPEVITSYKAFFGQLHGVHYLSEKLAEQTHEFGLINSNEHIIYQGVNKELFGHRKIELPEDYLRIITVSRLHYIKGLEFGILAVRELLKRNIKVQYTIVGGGPQADLLNYMVKSEGLGDTVKLVGEQSHAEVNALLESSNVLLHPHLVDGISNTMLEALLKNLKVVTFNSSMQSYNKPCLDEMIYEVERYNYHELADVLEDISVNKKYGTDTSLVEELLNDFSIEKHVQGFKNFFLS